MRTIILLNLLLTMACAVGCAESVLPPVEDEAPALTSAAVRAIADELRTRSGAPGVLLGVRANGQTTVVGSGSEDLLGLVPIDPERPFRVGSITKMFTGALLLRAVERGQLALSDTLEQRLEPALRAYPNASMVTLDMLLAHTAGITTKGFDDPAVLGELTADLTRVWSPDEVITRMSREPPYGAPGESGMQYANTGFVLLGEVLSELHGTPLAELYERELLGPLALADTRYGFVGSERLLPAYFELGGAPIDASLLPQQALLSFAGAAGALESTLRDTLTFLSALFEEQRVVSASSLSVMQRPASPDAWYGRALMRFCPCEPDAAGTRYAGLGHGGHVPGYWSVAVHYPARQVSIVALINRDVVDGVALDRSVFDPTLAAVLEVAPHAVAQAAP